MKTFYYKTTSILLLFSIYIFIVFCLFFSGHQIYSLLLLPERPQGQVFSDSAACCRLTSSDRSIKTSLCHVLGAQNNITCFILLHLPFFQDFPSPFLTSKCPSPSPLQLSFSLQHCTFQKKACAFLPPLFNT